MMDYAQILLAVAPHGKAEIRAGFAAALPDCIARADLSTSLRLAHFISQCAHESAGLATTTEYASGKAYEGRKDLGNFHPGDGPRFKGRGLIQITGRANYAHFSADLGVDLTKSPERAAEFPTAALSAAEYWKQHGLNKFADADDIEGVTRRVNGGLNGLASRKAYLAKAKAALADIKGALMQAAEVENAKAATKRKAAAVMAVSATATTTASTVPAVSDSNMVILSIVAVLVAAAGVWLLLSIRTHQDAAATLTAAAKEA